MATKSLLGGSWLVISGVISRVTIIITHTRGLITLLITTHEPPSRAFRALKVSGCRAFGFRVLGVLGFRV